MYKYILAHRDYLDKKIKENESGNVSKEELEELYVYHNTKIQWVQHERLVHLLVTLFVGFMFFAFFLLTFYTKELLFGLVALLFFILLFFYILHYYRLENSTQEMYTKSDELRKMILK